MDSTKKNGLVKKSVATVIVLGILIFLAIFIGPMDMLYHGYFSNRPNDVDIEAALDDDSYTFIDNTIEYTFTAETKHLEALEIYIASVPENSDDIIEITLSDSFGNILSVTDYEVSQLEADKWNKISFPKRLSQDETYKFILHVQNSEIQAKCLLLCGYAKSTLSGYGKLLVIAIFLLAGLLWCELIFGKGKSRTTVLCYFIVPYALVILLSWTYFSNPFDNENSTFNDFQKDSDSLIFDRIYAEEQGLPVDEYGLGVYYDMKGSLRDMSANRASIPLINAEDEGIIDGYCANRSCVVMDCNPYTTEYVQEGYTIKFETGKEYRIIQTAREEYGWYVYLDTDDDLNTETCGDLYNFTVLDDHGNELPSAAYVPYQSSVGLQGKIMAGIAKIFSGKNLYKIFSLICSVLAAITVVGCTLLLNKKYGKIFAGCFFIVFWLSPWVVNFAKSIFWVEFTWLLPFAVGLIIAIWIDRKIIRRLGYVAVFLTVLLKCLCGYEYVTFVMLGTVFVLIADFIVGLFEKNRAKYLKLLRTIVVVAIVALLGFLIALIIHGVMQGNGNLLQGLKSIYEDDVLRRTLGGDPDTFYVAFSTEETAESINASILEVLRIYFSFPTQVIAGISGNLFPIIAIIPLFVFSWNIYQKNFSILDASLYVITFFVSISWFILGKSHSYIHTSINFVCWYYWFVPTCFYIIVKQITQYIQKNRKCLPQADHLEKSEGNYGK